MNLGRWQWVGLVCVVACSRSNEPLPNKNTNWLNACESAEDCGDGQSCLCGLCTAVCGAASECDREDVLASCVAVADPRIEAQCAVSEHGDAVAICVPDALEVDAGTDAGPDGGSPIECGPCPEGWSCIDGMCAQVLAEGQPGLMAFARDAERLYWVNHGSFDRLGNYRHDGSIVAMPIDGGELVTLAGGRERPLGLQVDDGYAYWVDNTEPGEGESTTIMRVALGGGDPEPITSAAFIAPALAVDDAYVYFLSDGQDEAWWLQRTFKDGSGAPAQLMRRDLFPGVRELAVLDETLYWVDERASIVTAPKDGSGEEMMLKDGNGTATALAVEPGAIYFTRASETRVGLYVELLGAEELTLGTSQGDVPLLSETHGIGLDQQYVYWTWTDREAAGGVLARSERSPGDTEVLWTSPLIVRSLVALDDRYIYIAGRGESIEHEGTVLRIAKDGSGAP